MSEDEDPYVPLFEEYKKELRALYDDLVKEEDTAVKKTMDKGDINEDKARTQVLAERGPLVHNGRAIYLIRKYWLELARLEKERLAQDESFLEPLTFLVDDLIDEDENDLVDFLTQIAYWPIGLDENNEWC